MVPFLILLQLELIGRGSCLFGNGLRLGAENGRVDLVQLNLTLILVSVFG